MKLVVGWEVNYLVIITQHIQTPDSVMEEGRTVKDQNKNMKTTFHLIRVVSGPPLSAGQQWEAGGGLSLWWREHQAGGSASSEEQQSGEIPARDCPLHQ